MLIDNEFKNFLPALPIDKYKDLEQLILKHGCQYALITWNGILIDGHNRYKVCTEHNIPYETMEMEFDSADDAKLWMIENNFSRRDMNETEKQYFLGWLYNGQKAKITNPDGVKGKDKDKDEGQNVPQLRTSQKIADEYKVSERSVRRNGQFVTAIDEIAKNAGQDIKDKILNRDIIVSKRDAIAIAKLIPEKQVEAIQERQEPKSRKKIPISEPEIEETEDEEESTKSPIEEKQPEPQKITTAMAKAAFEEMRNPMRMLPKEIDLTPFETELIKTLNTFLSNINTFTFIDELRKSKNKTQILTLLNEATEEIKKIKNIMR